jgi:hypothetical protein
VIEDEHAIDIEKESDDVEVVEYIKEPSMHEHDEETSQELKADEDFINQVIDEKIMLGNDMIALEEVKENWKMIGNQEIDQAHDHQT